MTIVLSKTGSEHLYSDRNRQDMALALPGLKVVLDGCGSMDFSEVGAALFGQMLKQEYKDRAKLGRPTITPDNFADITWTIFHKMSYLMPTDYLKSQNLSFTILACFEMPEEFVVMSCGDGFIVKQISDEIVAEQLDDGEYPKYFVYNFIEDKAILNAYREGVDFMLTRYAKQDFVNIGVATDGWRFVENLSVLERFSIDDFLKQGKKGKIGMLINRNIQVFKDDISICF
ncbi:MAG: protein phosphatase 2C domain-containing protein [Candidatus Nomurabacteria bacterium]|jgi:hypothetical protein|nr:protein phosphatase 2C domain-containing protein [Candidatus Nomurabacteria bacterium]